MMSAAMAKTIDNFVTATSWHKFTCVLTLLAIPGFVVVLCCHNNNNFYITFPDEREKKYTSTFYRVFTFLQNGVCRGW